MTATLCRRIARVPGVAAVLLQSACPPGPHVTPTLTEFAFANSAAPA